MSRWMENCLAGGRDGRLLILGVLVLVLGLGTESTPVSVPLRTVSNVLIQRALESLNENSPTHHTYKSGNLISAQKLLKTPYTIYRLTLNLEPNCNEVSCPREACAIDLHQHEQGDINVKANSIQCMYLYPQDQSAQDEYQHHAQEVEDSDRGATNESVQLDHEVQTIANDASERPFIAVRATDKNYCAGCPYELNLTLPGLALLGEQVASSMDEPGRSEIRHKVVRIIRATRAVPPGSNVVKYELLLEIGQANCPGNNKQANTGCAMLPSIPIRLCLATFEERPWLRNSRKMSANNCTYSPESDNELNGDYQQRVAVISESFQQPQETTTETNPRTTELYDQIAQEGKLGTFASAIDELFETFEASSATESVNTEPRATATEEAITKIHLDTENEEQRPTGFTDKYKEFDAFLENFDIPIRTRRPEPETDGVPVTEEVIRPEVAVRKSLQTEPEVSSRSRRSIIDTPKSERGLVKKLAQEALTVLDDIDTDASKRVVLDVTDSKKEKITDETSIYYVTMRVAGTDCDERHKRASDCLEGIQGPSKICKVQIETKKERPLETARLLQLQCFREKSKREALGQAPGSPVTMSPDHPEIRAYAEQGLSKLSESFQGENKPFLVEITEATRQVVAGTLYKIKVKVGESTCSKSQAKDNCLLKANSEVNDYLITVLSVPWIDKGVPEVTVEAYKGDSSDQRAERDVLEAYDVDVSSHRMRKRFVAGGLSPISTSDPDIQKYAQKGVRKFAETSNSPNEPYLVDILEATSQVVSGMMYRIKVRLGESTCSKGAQENCQLKANSPLDDFLITVWSQPWIDHGNPKIKVENLSNKSQATRTKRQIEPSLGGTVPADPKDPKIMAYARQGLRKLSDTSNSHNEPFLIEILDATSQVVSGMLYKIRVMVGESTCVKGEDKDCQLKENSDNKEYLITIWSQPWVDNNVPDIKVKELTENHQRERRASNLGGLREEESKIRKKRSLRGVNYSAKMLSLYKDIGLEKVFDAFVSKYEKVYYSEEERLMRFEVFKENMKRIQKLQENERGTAIYGATIFADLTPEEFRARHTGLKPQLRSENELPLPVAHIPDIEIPKEFDWRHYNVVTEVKNQGSCGSCWAFSVTGNIESLNAIKTGKLLSLSEQELVDCDKLDEGCEGGLPDNAYRAIENLGGLELESDYPYDGEDEKCHFDKSKARVNIVSGLNITSNETQMAQWLVKNGPLSIGINANAMQFYFGGVSHPFKFLCDADKLDHGVLIVGYGVHKYPLFNRTMPFWIVKNSWGPRWGEQGYYRVYRGDGTCGVNRMVTSAILA